MTPCVGPRTPADVAAAQSDDSLRSTSCGAEVATRDAGIDRTVPTTTTALGDNDRWSHSRPDAAMRREPAPDALFETIFRDLPDIVLVIDGASGRIFEANQAVRHLLGRDPAGLVGRDFAEALALDGSGSPKTILDLVRQHAAATVDWDVRRIDGSLCPMHVRAAAARWGDREAVLVTLRDVTERRRTEAALRAAEHKYRSIYENSVEGIFQTTPDGRYLSANPALARIYGYPTPEALIADLTDIAGRLYVDPERRNEFRALLDEHDVVEGFESEVRRADASVVWISENARAVRDRSGALLYYEGTVVEITARKGAEEARRREIEALACADRLKSEFVATMSHELRTPLHIILGYDDLLLGEAFGSLTLEQVDALQHIARSGRDLLALIDATLDLARLDSGRLPLAIRPLDVPALLRDVAAEVAHLTSKPGVRVRWEIEAQVGSIVADSAKLKVVLQNLIDNAMKFTDAGEVRIGARRARSGVELSVADTGIGIAPDALPIIFDAFRQADGSMTRRHGGIGLGLHLVQRLVELMGGTIDVESTPGAGSTFRVWIPAEPS